MASIAMMVGGAVVNAVAFSGSGYLFSKLGHEDAQKEQARHDKAVEQLQAARDAWSKQRTERLDWLNEELQRQGHAIRTFTDVDQAMQDYAQIKGADAARNIREAPEPVLSDFYVPSEAQKDREILFILGGLAVTGFVAYKLAK